MTTPHCSRYAFLALILVAAAASAAAGQIDWNRNWPQWRGPLGSGVAPSATPPLEWGETKNVKWTAHIPGSGSATPIVWDDRIFILTAIPAGTGADRDAEPAETTPGRDGRETAPKSSEMLEFTVICLDRADGHVLWQKIARKEVPHEGHHRDGTFASASPTTDGEHLLAYFGSRGLYCYDLDGDLKWDADFGDMTTRNSFGEGSSPALHGDRVVVVWDHEGDDFVVALDKRTGKELWRVRRDEGTNWTTPLIVELNGKSQVIVAGRNGPIGYDLQTGEQLWRGPELTGNVIPHPVAMGDAVIVMSGFRGAALHAIRLDGSGDLTGTDAVLWSYDRNTPYVPSPVLTDSFLYFASRNSGILTCLNARTGEPYFSAERLEGISDIYASPVAAGNRIYVLGRKGTCLVIERGPELKILATNKLNDDTDASAALVGNEIFIRGRNTLYCIAAE